MAVGSLLAAGAEYSIALRRAAWGDTRPRSGYCSAEGPTSRPRTPTSRRRCAGLYGTDTRPRSACCSAEGPTSRSRIPPPQIATLNGYGVAIGLPLGRKAGVGAGGSSNRTPQNTSAFRMRGHKTTVDGEAGISAYDRAADPEIATGGCLWRMRCNGWAAA